MIAGSGPAPLGSIRAVPTQSRPGLKGRAIDLVLSAMQRSGTAAIYSGLTDPQGAVILMYHSVPSPDAAPWIDPRNAMPAHVFREQMQHLAMRRHVVSMTRLAELLATGETPARGTVVLTFDDGYRDNLDVVAPVLAEFGLPAVLYLPTGYITRGETQWVDRLYIALRARTRHVIEIDDPVVAGRWSLDSDSSTRAAYTCLCRGLIRASWEARERVLATVLQQLGAIAQPPRLMLTWDEIRSLMRRFPTFEIGGHTVDHVDLTSHAADVGRAEVRGCADTIERETGRRPIHFSYPYGRASTDARRIVEECGFRTAVGGAADALVTAKSDLLRLPRTESPASRSLFRAHASGVGPHLMQRLARRV